ncbi:MAG: hypothetical protein AVDCRST_MAG85-581, partial [uncultured Solirubrobacteraceae bacterium]
CLSPARSASRPRSLPPDSGWHSQRGCPGRSSSWRSWRLLDPLVLATAAS